MATKKETAADEREQPTNPELKNSPPSPPAAPDPDAAAEAEKILADAKAQAAKIVADAKAQAEKEAATPPGGTAEPADTGEELVSIRLFKDNEKYKDDVFVAVNGERLQIKRGETVQIKRKYADVLEQSMKQDTATANMIERESADFESKAAALQV